MNTAADVTDLNLAKLKVEQSEKNFRNMILQAPVAMCILTGPEHIVEIANQLMIELWGKQASVVLNKPVFDALPDARAQGLEQLLEHVFKSGETFIANERPVELLRRGRMEVVYLNFVYEPYKDGDGTILGVLAVATEVTDQVLARQKIEEIVSERTEELANVNDNLRKSNAELAQFAYIASHDLQEPLRKISTYSQMLENKLDDCLDVVTRNYLNKINNSSARMNTLIRDVLTYSELVKQDQLFSSVDLNTVVNNILTDYELLIEQKSASVNFEKLPVIEAIPLQMYQLFGNLLGNALKFSKKDITPSINISFTTATEEELKLTSLATDLQYYNIQFSDNGIGFKSEHAEQIFNIFQRLHRKSEYEGTGIGLAMCRKIAQNHNGEINAIGSSEGRAVFNVFLPKKQTTIAGVS
jgi:PAS domain S-box-containing protein